MGEYIDVEINRESRKLVKKIKRGTSFESQVFSSFLGIEMFQYFEHPYSMGIFSIVHDMRLYENIN